MSSERGFVSVKALQAPSRREVLRRVALAVTAAGLAQGIDPADGAQVHAEVESERTFRGEYDVKYFNAREFRALERLAELVVPADEGGPSAREGGAPEFIDLLASQNRELADIFTGGILWLDAAAAARGGKQFADAAESDQTALLDALVAAERAYGDGETRWATGEYARFSVFGIREPAEARRGLRFFGWARRLIVDAYYTSPVGIKDLGFVGNSSHTDYEVPREAIEYAFGRSPVREA